MIAMELNPEGKPDGLMKVKDLRPSSKKVNVLVKVTWVGQPREIHSRTGEEAERVAEARVGDETGTILLSLRQDQIGSVREGDVLFIDNGYISLVQGRMRLNVGEHGRMTKVDHDIPNVNTEVDASAAVDFHKKEQERGGFRPRYGGGHGGRRKH
jgi:replication factor A1